MIERDNLLAKNIVEKGLNVRISKPFGGLVVYDRDGASGAAIINNHDGRDCHLSIVMNRRMRVGDARSIARYIFGALDLHRVTAVTRRTNGRARAALLSLGFEQEGVMRDHFDTADGIVYGLLRSDQKIVRL